MHGETERSVCCSMGRPWLLVLLTLLVHQDEALETINIGSLVSFNYGGGGPWPPNYETVTAIALEDINNSNVLKSYSLNVTHFDSNCEAKDGLIAMVRELDRAKTVKGFIGPGCSEVCKNTAYIASKEGFNVPMISYGCTLDSLSSKTQYSTFARTVNRFGSTNKTMINVIERFGWGRVGIIYRNIGLYEEAAANLRKALIAQNITVNCYKVWYAEKESAESLIEKEQTAKTIRTECATEVRIFIILAYDSDVIMFTKKAQADTDFPFAKSVFIAYEMTHNTVNEESKKYTLGLISLSIPNPNSTNFTVLAKKVRDRTGEPDGLDVYSATLYDAIWTYALAAQQILDRDNSTVQDIWNGTEMASVISNLPMFQGASGNVSFDNLASRQADTEVVMAQENVAGKLELIKIFNGHLNGTEWILTNFTDPLNMTWATGLKDIPDACGDDNELCSEPDLQKTILLVVLPIGILLLVIAAVILIFLMWRSKVQRLQDRCLWKIRSCDVEFKDAANQGSKFRSLDRSMSRMSNMSENSLRHGIVAYFKNNPVYLKHLNAEVKQFTVTDRTILEFKQVRELTHQNCNPYIGACVEVPDHFFLASLYCRKGSLQDILSDSNMKIDNMFKMSFLFDICKGMAAIHNSPIKFHGRLKSCNCVIDAHWVLKITDYGLRDFLSENSLIDPMKSDDGKCFDQLWSAPEVLKYTLPGTPKGDIYSFAIIVTEIFSRSTPYGDTNCTSKEIISKVTAGYNPPFRPDMPAECAGGLDDLVRMCWDENPLPRPDFLKVLSFLQQLHPEKQRSITDRMIKMMEQYTDNLEDIVAERSEQLALEKEKADNLLCRMLPKQIAEKLKQGEAVAPQAFDEVTIYFSDIVGFTDLSSQSTPFQVVDLLNDLYTLFDGIVERHDVYKVETIGDAYMVVSGLPNKNGKRHAAEIANMSLDLLDAVRKFAVRHVPGYKMMLRIGMHTGSVCAGVVGLKMPRYCLFGDTVNTASRMESNGEALKIHMSQESKIALDFIGGYVMECRGEISIKGKGMLTTWWLITAPQHERLGSKHKPDTDTTAILTKPKNNNHVKIVDNNDRQRRANKLERML